MEMADETANRGEQHQPEPPSGPAPPEAPPPPEAAAQPSTQSKRTLWIVVAIVGVVVLCSMCSCAGLLGLGSVLEEEIEIADETATEPVEEPKPPEDPEETAPVETLDSVEETEGEPAPGTRGNPLPLGTTARIGDWEVKVTEVNLNANEVIASENPFNDPPADGTQFILVTLEAKYVGEESSTFWASMSYKFYGSAGNTFSSGGAVIPSPIRDAGETFPGAEIFGNVLFEVPSDQIDSGAIIMEESLSFRDTRVFFAVR